jgi:hypothetical protein
MKIEDLSGYQKKKMNKHQVIEIMKQWKEDNHETFKSREHFRE